MWDIEKYLSTLQCDNTRKAYERNLDLLCEYADWQEPTPELIGGFVRFLLGRGNKPKTIRQRLQTLKSWLKFRYEHRFISTSDWYDLGDPIDKALGELPSGDDDDRALPSREEIERALKAINEAPPNLENLRDRALFLLIFATGIRIGEACDLTYGDVNWKTGLCRIVAKGDKKEVVYIPPLVLDALKDYRDLRNNSNLWRNVAISKLPVFIRHDKKASKNQWEMSTRTGENIYKKIKGRAGIKSDFTPHVFRQYASTNMLIKSGGNAFMVQDALCHNQVITTRGYVHLGKDYSIEQLKRLGNELLEPI